MNDGGRGTKIDLPVDKALWQPTLLAGQIVLVSSRSSRGDAHAARKTWISMVASDPPMIGLSCRLSHRTAINILETREFVVNIPGEDLAAAIWRAGDAVTAQGGAAEAPALTFVASRRIAAPSVQECRGHIECVLESTRRLTEEELIFFARIVSVSIDESLTRGSAEDRYARLRLPFFLEEDLYGVIETARKIET